MESAPRPATNDSDVVFKLLHQHALQTKSLVSRFGQWEFSVPCLRSAAGVLVVYLFPGATLLGVVLCSLLLHQSQATAHKAFSLVEKVFRATWTGLPFYTQFATVLVGFIVVSMGESFAVWSAGLPMLLPFSSLALMYNYLYPLCFALGSLLALKLGADITLRNVALHVGKDA